MKLEKRSESSSAEQTTEVSTTNRQKPVFAYILILFTVAFALILLSFAMHQRSNQQVLGELYNNVNALENLQEALEENFLLEQRLSEETEASQALKEELEAATEHSAILEKQIEALTLLYCLQQTYSTGDYAGCQQLIELIEQCDYDSFLLKSIPGHSNITSPAQRYLQLKEAVEVQTAATGE